MVYRCIKCGRKHDWAGLCPECYMKIYKFTEEDIELIQTRKIKAKDDHLRLAKDDMSGGEVAETLEDAGIKNPLLVDKKYNLLVGHHRFNHLLNKGIEKAPVVIKETAIYSRFTEGSAERLFVAFLGDIFVLNVCRWADVQGLFSRLPRAIQRSEIDFDDCSKIEIEIYKV